MLIKQIRQFFGNPSKFIEKLFVIFTGRLWTEKSYVKWRYRQMMGNKVDLENPKTFSEKLQWLKIYYRNPIITKLADKFEAREFVKERIGEIFLIPLYKVFNHYSEIKIEDLPARFALKATHGSGWNVICKNKENLDWSEVKYLLKRYYNTNMYWINREWSYKHIKPRFVCEKLLSEKDDEPPADYKFFCFNGEPRLFVIDYDRFKGHKRNFYDCCGNRLPLRVNFPNFDIQFEKPKNFNLMIELARKLSNKLPFVRVDLYNINGKIYFGEMTFYPWAGYVKFQPDEWDQRLGSWIQLEKFY